MSVLSVAGQLIRWEHTPTHFSVDFLVFTYCIKLYSLALLNMKTPLQAQDRHCKDRVWVSELKWKPAAAGQKQRLLFKEWASWWRQTSGWIGRKVKLATQYKCTCAATCPHTHLPNNHPAQQDLLPLECVNHLSHTVALITARYVIAFILMCYFPAARPWLSECVANKGVWLAENPCLVRCCLRSPWATWSWWCDDAKRIHCRACLRACWTACHGGQILKQ